MREIDLGEWFDDKPEDILLGIELELLLFDSKKKEPVKSKAFVEDILNKLPKEIYMDYYAWQLEIRTKPRKTAEEVIKETIELYKMAHKEFIKKGIYIIPAPSIVLNQEAFCGLHIHVSYPKLKDKKLYYEKAMGMYPFMMSLSDHSKNFEIDDMNASERMKSSKHIGMAELSRKDFLYGTRDNNNRKYKDLIFSPAVNHSTNRHRLDKDATIEIRAMDTPSLLSFYEFMIRYIFEIASHIKVDNPMVRLIDSSVQEADSKVSFTRRLIAHQRYGVNKIFRMWNADVCESVSERFGIPFSRQTQFEYREELGISSDVNGYLSMAVEGGWLD